MTRELEPDNAGARSHCVAANALRAFDDRGAFPVQKMIGVQLSTLN
jgi:hypothetical protein